MFLALALYDYSRTVEKLISLTSVSHIIVRLMQMIGCKESNVLFHSNLTSKPPMKRS